MVVVNKRLRLYWLNFYLIYGKYQIVLCCFIQKYRNVLSRFLQKYVILIIFSFPLSYLPAFPYLCSFNFSKL